MSKGGGLAHQDWEILYVHCKTSKPSNVENKGVSVKKKNNNNSEHKMDKQIEEGNMSQEGII